MRKLPPKIIDVEAYEEDKLKNVLCTCKHANKIRVTLIPTKEAKFYPVECSECGSFVGYATVREKEIQKFYLKTSVKGCYRVGISEQRFI